MFLSKSSLDHDFSYFDLEVNYEITNFEANINDIDFLTQHQITLDQDIYQEVANELSSIGSTIPLSSVHRLIDFKKKMAAATITAYWQTFGQIAIISSLVIFLILFCLIFRYAHHCSCGRKPNEPSAEMEMHSVPPNTPMVSPTPYSDSKAESLWLAFIRSKFGESIDHSTRDELFAEVGSTPFLSQPSTSTPSQPREKKKKKKIEDE